MHRGLRLIMLLAVGLTISTLLGAIPAVAAMNDPLNTNEAELAPQGVTELDNYWRELMEEYGGFFPENRSPTWKEMLQQESGGFTFKGIIEGLFRFFLHELLQNGKLLVTIVILTVFSLLLETLQAAFERASVSKVAFAISYLVLVVLAINSFYVAIGYASDAIGRMVHFMVAMMPMLLTLLASMGNLISVTVMHPLIVFMVHTIGTLIYTVIFPLLFFSAVLHIVSSLSEKYQVTQLANLLRTIGTGLLGACLTVFLGIISIRGASAAITDGVTIRTAKYVTGNFVPVVGKMFSDATDTVLGASLLVKNAIGLSGVILLVLLCAFPAMKILVLALIYHVAAAVIQPLGQSPIAACLQTIGKSMIYVFAALASAALMFFLAITMLLAASNVSVMLR